MSIYHHKRRRLFTMIEAVPGVPNTAGATFVSGNGKLPVYDLKVTPKIENMDRNPDGLTFDGIDSVRWGENYDVTFKTDAYTLAAGIAPAYGLLLKACGMAETTSAGVSVTYTVDSDACPTITMGIEQTNDAGNDAKRIIVAGCLGSFTIDAEQIGKSGMISWTFTGKATLSPDDDGNPVATVVYDDSTTSLPQLRSTTITDGTVSVQANKFSFNRGLVTEWETDLSDATGYKKRIVASSKPTLTIDPAKIPGATKTVLEELFKGTPGAVVVTLGSLAGKRIKINMTRAQKDSLSDDARGVTSTWGTTFHANRGTLTGNGDDAVTIVLD